VHVPKKPDIARNFEPELYIEEVMYQGLPVPGKILLEELIKVLYLNNANPKLVRFSYKSWHSIRSATGAKYFQLIQKLSGAL